MTYNFRVRLHVASCLLFLFFAFMSSGTPQDIIQRLSPAMDDLIAKDAQLTKLASGFTWTEGPVWMPGGYLLFADIPANSIHKWTPGGSAPVFIHPSGYQGSQPYGGPEPGSNGMTLDSRGRLTVAGHAGRNVWRLESDEPQSGVTVLADAYEGKKLNSPNDLVYRSDGSLYFTDPPYGFRTQSDKDPDKELTFNGVYRIASAASQKPGAPPDPHALQLLVKDLPRPNGIAFSPDEKVLYVSNSEPHFWMRYTVLPDGSVKDGQKFSDVSTDKAAGGPDGIKIDLHGNIYGTGPGGIWIFSPEGQHLGTILMPEKAANLAWGGPDYRTLFITASTSVYSLPVKVGGKKAG